MASLATASAAVGDEAFSNVVQFISAMLDTISAMYRHSSSLSIRSIVVSHF